jgi:hypothetical protein
VSTRTAQRGTFSRLMLTIAAMSAIALSMIWLAGPVLATHVEPVFVAGNHSCGQLNVAYDHEFKIEPVESGNYVDPDSDFIVDITVNDTPEGQTVDFDANLGVDAVFVKGASDGNLYVYDPAETSDTGLHAPLNASGKWGGLSHLSFCFNDTPEESASPSAEESVGESAEQSVEASGEQSQKAGEGTPEESQADSALSGLGSSPLATIAFSLILLASLGTLAYANVKAARSRI